MGLMDDLRRIMRATLKDGMNLGGDVVGLIDDAHRQKLEWLVKYDVDTFYKIQTKIGIDIYDESYYGKPTSIRALNPDHFLIQEKYKGKLNLIRQFIYKTIDDVCK